MPDFSNKWSKNQNKNANKILRSNIRLEVGYRNFSFQNHLAAP